MTKTGDILREFHEAGFAGHVTKVEQVCVHGERGELLQAYSSCAGESLAVVLNDASIGGGEQAFSLTHQEFKMLVYAARQLGFEIEPTVEPDAYWTPSEN